MRFTQHHPIRTSLALLALASAPLACSSASSPSSSSDDAGTGSTTDDAGSGVSAQADSSSSQSADAGHQGHDGGTSASSDAGSSSSSGDAGGDDSSTVSSGDAASGSTFTMQVTWYGWDDNSPPGNAIAYPANAGNPTIHNSAGGTGTYADPITFATDKDEWPPGTILYLPFAKKYVIMEDDCTQCDSDWQSGQMRHIDIWMNSDGSEDPNALFTCEGNWTQSAAQVIAMPAQNLAVTTTPLFDPSTNTCRTTP